MVTYSALPLLVTHHRGTLPIVLTCPHDGEKTPAVVSERTKDKTPKTCPFKTVRDRRTADITRRVAEDVLSRTGLSPYVVIAQFGRKFIDANRPVECAYTHPSGKPYYQAYHSQIAAYVQEVVDQNAGRGFLFDIHGTKTIASDPADIYLGTDDGATVTMAGFKRQDLFAQHGLRGLLAAAAYLGGTDAPITFRVSPAAKNVKETTEVTGGFTVREYSKVLNCVQIELANTMRDTDAAVDRTVDALAWALVNFVRRYVPF